MHSHARPHHKAETVPLAVPGNGDHGIIGCQAGKNAILVRCRVAWWPGSLGVDLTEPDQHIGGAQSLPHRLQDDWMTYQPGGLRANPVSPSGKMWKSPLIKKNMCFLCF